MGSFCLQPQDGRPRVMSSRVELYAFVRDYTQISPLRPSPDRAARPLAIYPSDYAIPFGAFLVPWADPPDAASLPATGLLPGDPNSTRSNLIETP